MKPLTIPEVGYVADISKKSVDRYIDRKVVPAIRRKKTRLLTDVGAVVLAVEVVGKETLQPSARKRVRKYMFDVLRRDGADSPEWARIPVEIGGATTQWDVSVVREEVLERLGQIERMRERIVEDDEIQAGAPTFRDTRILVRPIARALEQGVSAAELLEDYPDLDGEALELAKLFDKVRPQRGRPVAPKKRASPLRRVRARALRTA